ARDPDCGRLRELLASGRGWLEALAELRLSPALDRLVYLARWVTPESVPRRFDTCFYVARRPTGQTVRPQAGEVADGRRMPPPPARGRWPVPPPRAGGGGPQARRGRAGEGGRGRGLDRRPDRLGSGRGVPERRRRGVDAGLDVLDLDAPRPHHHPVHAELGQH